MAEENKKELEPDAVEESAAEDVECAEAENAEQGESGEEVQEETDTDSGEAENDEQQDDSEVDADDQDEDSDTEEPVKKSLFGKKKNKKDKKDEKIEELTDRLQRSMAEFDNFRKRTEKEKASMYIIGAKEIIEKILPVVDNFERGLDTAQEGDAFADGMQMIYKQLMTTLNDLGVQAIEAVGQPFDPNFHNAVMHVDDPEQEENIVVEEFQKGYTYKDFVVRHSMVKVAN